jgi:hypothetical protein
MAFPLLVTAKNQTRMAQRDKGAEVRSYCRRRFKQVVILRGALAVVNAIGAPARNESLRAAGGCFC